MNYVFHYHILLQSSCRPAHHRLVSLPVIRTTLSVILVCECLNQVKESVQVVDHNPVSVIVAALHLKVLEFVQSTMDINLIFFCKCIIIMQVLDFATHS